jgi:hypothetical protein
VVAMGVYKRKGLTIIAIIDAAKHYNPYDASHNHKGTKNILALNICADQHFCKYEVENKSCTT